MKDKSDNGQTSSPPDTDAVVDISVSKQMAQKAMSAAVEAKAKDVVALDLRQVSLVADYFVLASGTSTIHTQAIARRLIEAMDQAGYRLLRREGYQESLWILLDYGDVVVHVFREEERHFYDLERLWGDAQTITPAEVD